MSRKFLLLFLFLFTLPLFAQDVASFEKRVQVRVLPNGLTVLLMQRKEAPVFSFYTFVDAGSSQDPKTKAGLAHMFEHMAFKGTDTIGTTNYAQEKVSSPKMEKAYTPILPSATSALDRIRKSSAALEKQWKDLIEQADKFVIRNQFGELIEQNGGVGMNASTRRMKPFTSIPCRRTDWNSGRTSSPIASWNR